MSILQAIKQRMGCSPERGNDRTLTSILAALDNLDQRVTRVLGERILLAQVVAGKIAPDSEEGKEVRAIAEKICSEAGA